MRNRFLVLASLCLFAGSAYAQNSLENEIDADLDQMSVSAQKADSAPAAAVIAPQGSANGQPIYILNQATPTSTSQVQQQAEVQKQPEVEISAAPLTKSRAEQLREARQQREIETENKLVEKLEQARMEDERRRAQVLFGDAFAQQSNQNNINAQNVNVQQQTAPVQPVQVAPVQVAPTPVVTSEPEPVEEKIDSKEMIRAEVRAAMESEQKLPEEPLQKRYFSANLGVGEYPDVSNVQGNYHFGATFGTKYDDAFAIEGTFSVSEYTVEPLFAGYPFGYGYYTIPRTVEARQYAGSIGGKYYFMGGMIKPNLGGLVQYSYRTFTWNNNYYGSGSTSESANSHAIDLGTSVGVDFEFGNKWTLGLDFRYMWNLSSRANLNNQSMFLESDMIGKPIEKLQYYTMSLAARVNF